MLEALKMNAAFSDVKLLYMRQSEGRNREVAFAVSFTFVADSE